jgi:hypothetical protein
VSSFVLAITPFWSRDLDEGVEEPFMAIFRTAIEEDIA